MIEDLSTISSVSERHFDFNIFSIYPPGAFFSTERQFNIIIILSFLSDRHLGAYGSGQHEKRAGRLVGFIQHYGLMELGCKCAWYIIKNAILFNTGYKESLLGLLLDVLFIDLSWLCTLPARDVFVLYRKPGVIFIQIPSIWRLRHDTDRKRTEYKILCLIARG